jgi:hypothetical protein
MMCSLGLAGSGPVVGAPEIIEHKFPSFFYSFGEGKCQTYDIRESSVASYLIAFSAHG